jgi:hypothetical protein
VRGIGSRPLLPLELDASDVDPPLRILELRASLPRSLESLPCCLRGANMLCCSFALLLCGVVPPRALRGIVGGSGGPNLRWVTAVGGITLVVVVHAVDVPAIVPSAWDRPPLPPGGRSACMLCRSVVHVSSVSVSSSIDSSRVMIIGLLTSSNWPIYLA